MNGEFEYAVRPPVVTVIGAYDAPVGAVTVSEVELAEVTTAFTAPKYTMLSAGVVLKLEPLIVTLEPTLPEVGLNEEIVTTCAAVSNEKAAAQTTTRTARSIVFIVLSPMLACRNNSGVKRKLILDFISTSNTWDCEDTAYCFPSKHTLLSDARNIIIKGQPSPRGIHSGKRLEQKEKGRK
jgi:hypothetical protein